MVHSLAQSWSGSGWKVGHRLRESHLMASSTCGRQPRKLFQVLRAFSAFTVQRTGINHPTDLYLNSKLVCNKFPISWPNYHIITRPGHSAPNACISIIMFYAFFGFTTLPFLAIVVPLVTVLTLWKSSNSPNSSKWICNPVKVSSLGVRF